MTDYHFRELCEARGLLAFMAGVFKSAAKQSSDIDRRDHFARCEAEIDAFLKRPLFQDQEAA